ncbi:MAG: FMN-binding protein [Spirochaetaceae bacterium]|nr:MAG: FMN-binding protein [Spirochaetaceae bacterium]
MSQQPTPPPMPSPIRLVLTLALIAMLSGVTVVFAYQITLEPIARNHRLALERAVFEVLPGAVERANFLVEGDSLSALSDDEGDRANVYAGYDEDGDLIGVAMEGSARGYADNVRVLYGYSLEDECIIGFTVLQSSETPGLGEKIGSDPAFLANFECLDVRLNDAGTDLANPIRTVGPGEGAEPWEIDGIAGATVSSQAVGRALRESASRMIPVIREHAQLLTEERN